MVRLSRWSWLLLGAPHIAARRPPEGIVAGDVRLSFRVPRNGSSVMPRVEPEVDLWVDDHRIFVAVHGATTRMCCELDGAATGCESLDATRIAMPGALSEGPHALTCALLDNENRSVLRPAPAETSYFTVVSDPLETDDGRRLWDLYREDRERGSDKLRAWWLAGGARSETLEGLFLPPPPYPWATTVPNDDDEPPLLVIGVKCAADAIEARDAMRRTWLQDVPADGSVQVRFLVGAVDDDVIAEALEREQQQFGDMLIPSTGFSVRDSYLSLVDKTKAFLRYVLVDEKKNASFVMLVDDDVLVRVPALLEALKTSVPRRGFYGGQVWAEHFNQPKLPQRDPTHRNYLSEATYPMSQLPPFAIGPHYVLSADVAQFIATNAEALAGVGTLEDVSVALWLLAIGVHPQHSEQFVNARLFGCVAEAVSLADLTPRGILAIHANRRQGRDACAGFDELAWVKTPRFSVVKQQSTGSSSQQSAVGDDEPPRSFKAATVMVEPQTTFPDVDPLGAPTLLHSPAESLSGGSSSSIVWRTSS
mmetsp:Transcript_560/g.2184  ORF Transcript_560/g.2184 Transcript_560/m.2184 type:complete len:535 (+) Transcript_560:2346-3950(+)